MNSWFGKTNSLAYLSATAVSNFLAFFLKIILISRPLETEFNSTMSQMASGAH